METDLLANSRMEDPMDLGRFITRTQSKVVGEMNTNKLSTMENFDKGSAMARAR